MVFILGISPQVKRTLHIIRDKISSTSGKVKPSSNKDLGVHGWKNWIYDGNHSTLGCQEQGLFQSELALVVQFLLLALTVSLKIFKVYPTKTDRDHNVYENTFQQLFNKAENSSAGCGVPAVAPGYHPNIKQQNQD